MIIAGEFQVRSRRYFLRIIQYSKYERIPLTRFVNVLVSFNHSLLNGGIYVKVKKPQLGTKITNFVDFLYNCKNNLNQFTIIFGGRIADLF